MKHVKKLLAVGLTLMVLVLLTAAAVAADAGMPTIKADTVSAKAGDQLVEVKIQFLNNPGIASVRLKVTYDDSALSLTSIEYNNGWGGMSQQPQTKTSPVTLAWFNGSGDYSEADSVFATLKFDVSDNAVGGEKIISIAYEADDLYDISETNVPFDVIDGKIVIDSESSETDKPTIIMDTAEADVGDKSVNLSISFTNNPGIASVRLKVAYDKNALSLAQISYNSAWGGMFQQPQSMNTPVTLAWFNGSGNYTGADSVFADLTFDVLDTAAAGDSIITITYEPDDLYNIDEDNVTFEVVDGKITISEPPAPALSAQLFGHTLTLKGEIGVNSYMIFDDGILADAENYQVEFWKDGDLAVAKTVAESTPEVKQSGGVSYTVYPFTVTAVAKDMDTVFTMKIQDLQTEEYIDFANSDGSMVNGNEGLDYRINDYLDDRIASSTDDSMVQLAKDMKAYGVFAKHYFAAKAGSTEPMPEIEGFEVLTADDLSDYAYTAPGKIDHFTYKGTTLLLEEETTFRLYFQSDDKDALTVSIGDDVLPIKSGKGMYYVEVRNIRARDLDLMYDFSISNGTDSTTAHHGPFGYAYWALSSSSNEGLRYTMMALYHYNQAAKAYFN